MNNKTSDILIDELAGHPGSLRGMPHPALRALGWIVFAVFYTAVATVVIGVRPDISNVLRDSTFLFENGLMLALGIVATLASSWLCVPDMRGQKWPLFLPSGLLAVFILWSAFRAGTEGQAMPEFQWGHCLTAGFLFAAVPVAAIVFLARGGATVHPYIMAVMNILAAGAFGYIALRFTCVVDTIGHGCLYHLFPSMVVGAILGLTARRLYRW